MPSAQFLSAARHDIACNMSQTSWQRLHLPRSHHVLRIKLTLHTVQPSGSFRFWQDIGIFDTFARASAQSQVHATQWHWSDCYFTHQGAGHADLLCCQRPDEAPQPESR